MKRKPRYIRWLVSWGLSSILVSARHRAGAVHRAFRAWQRPCPRTDHETGGWKGLSVESARPSQ